jgi:Ca2+-binding RTX toxin-like protein
MVVRIGSPGPDELIGTSDPDTLRGFDGADELIAGDGDDLLDGGTGDDVLRAGTGNDTVYGGAGNDRLFADAGIDSLYGGADDDAMLLNDINYGGLTTAYGGTGNDTFSLFEMSGATITGGSGLDMLGLYCVTTTDLFVDFSAGVITKAGAFDGGVSYVGVERLSVLTYGGDDTVLGGVYDDVLNVGGGANEVNAKAGNDHVYYVPDTANILRGGAGVDILTVNTLDNTLYFIVDGLDGSVDDGQLSLIIGFEIYEAFGDVNNDIAAFASGNDSFKGNLGDDTVFGRDGDDLLWGQRGNDSLSGGDGNDSLTGDQGDDTFEGGSGNDRIGGGNGLDLIDAGDGDDRIVLYLGADSVTGGAGRDSFLFVRDQTDQHRLTDFTSGTDRLVFSTLLLPGAPSAGRLDPSRLSLDAASGPDGQFVLTYDAGTDTSLLQWDANGDDPAGTALGLASFTGQPTLTADDIWIV